MGARMVGWLRAAAVLVLVVLAQLAAVLPAGAQTAIPHRSIVIDWPEDQYVTVPAGSSVDVVVPFHTLDVDLPFVQTNTFNRGVLAKVITPAPNHLTPNYKGSVVVRLTAPRDLY